MTASRTALSSFDTCCKPCSVVLQFVDVRYAKYAAMARRDPSRLSSDDSRCGHARGLARLSELVLPQVAHLQEGAAHGAR